AAATVRRIFLAIEIARAARLEVVHRVGGDLPGLKAQIAHHIRLSRQLELTSQQEVNAPGADQLPEEAGEAEELIARGASVELGVEGRHRRGSEGAVGISLLGK